MSTIGSHGLMISVCVEMLYRELPFVERLRAVEQAGCPAYEFWRLAGKDLDSIVAEQQRLGLICAGLLGGEDGRIADPSSRDRYLASLERAVAAARKLGAKSLIVTSGDRIPDLSPSAQYTSMVEALKESLPIVEPRGITLVLEPLNSLVDHRGIFLDRSADGFRIIDEVNSPNVKLLYDIYHMQVMEGNLIATIQANLDQIGHLHVADVPGRHEPGTGEINYRNVFRAISEAGYRGFVGLEFRPSVDSAAALAAVRNLL